MTIVKYAFLFTVGLLTLASQTEASLINITNDLGSPAVFVTDYDKGLLGGLGDSQVAGWLADEISAYNLFLNAGADLLLPAGVDLGAGSSGLAAVDLTGYSYAVLHYGKGSGGLGHGGGIQAFYLNGTNGVFSFPATGLGPNGLGGISFVRLYGPSTSPVPPPPSTVPDGGSTMVLLAFSLTGLESLRRRLLKV